MNRLARQVIEDRAVRNQAREGFDSNLARVKQDLEVRGVGGRIADKFGQEAKGIYEEAIAVADDNRAVIAGTIAALAIWFLRNPIIAWLESLLGNGDEGNADEIEEES